MDVRKEIYDIRKYENLALKYQSYGFHVSFSGGKDSIVLYDILKKSGVKFQGYFYNTGLEHPEIPIFIKRNYPEIIHLRPVLPFHEIVIKKGFLPSRKCRFCCEFLKECHGKDSVVVDGVRSSESYNRSLRDDFEFSCIGGHDKIFKHLLFNWSEDRIWKYIHDSKLQVPNVYKEFNRVGCIGCPMQCKDTAIKEFEMYPNFFKFLVKIIQKSMNEGTFKGYSSASSAKEYVENWINSFSRDKFSHPNSQLSLELNQF